MLQPFPSCELIEKGHFTCFQMADGELVKKMLRAILQANKGGVSLSRLQSEYKELTGSRYHINKWDTTTWMHC
ncbi:hypothetical protein INR49_027920 [Caranx melampygus]|nr:hypothetical protein INR49_027920 [Caranx melampygus]